MGAITVGRDRNFRGFPDLQNHLRTPLGLPDATKRLPDHLPTSPDMLLIFLSEFTCSYPMFREFQVSGDWFLDRNVVERCRDKATTNQFGEITNFEISCTIKYQIKSIWSVSGQDMFWEQFPGVWRFYDHPALILAVFEVWKSSKISISPHRICSHFTVSGPILIIFGFLDSLIGVLHAC